MLPENSSQDGHIDNLGRMGEVVDNTCCPKQHGAAFITPYELDTGLPFGVGVIDIGCFFFRKVRFDAIQIVHLVEIEEGFFAVRIFREDDFRIDGNGKQGGCPFHHFFTASHLHFAFQDFTGQLFHIRNVSCFEQGV